MLPSLSPNSQKTYAATHSYCFSHMVSELLPLAMTCGNIFEEAQLWPNLRAYDLNHMYAAIPHCRKINPTKACSYKFSVFLMSL